VQGELQLGKMALKLHKSFEGKLKESQMRRQWQINPHLALISIASVALAGANAYFLMVLPKRLVQSDPEWLRVGASWATAFFAQLGVFLAIVCPVAVHALSGRWSWSVRIFVVISAYAGLRWRY
jgi:hypothetical protein